MFPQHSSPKEKNHTPNYGKLPTYSLDKKLLEHFGPTFSYHKVFYEARVHHSQRYWQ